MNYIFCGVQRSGNHAIINWVQKQIGNGVAFDNNLNLGKFLSGELVPNDLTQYINYRPDKRHVVSLENVTYQNILEINKRYDSPETKKIIVIRDCYNLIASLVAFGGHNIDHMKTIWKDNARTVVCGHFAILFNKWFQDVKYRKRLCNELDIEYSDNGISDIMPYGGGSSFDGVSFCGRAHEMDVLNRWKRCVGEEFAAYFDDEMHELNAVIFKFSLKGRLLYG